MKISPTTHTIIAIAVAVLWAAAKGSIALPLGIPASWAPYISSWSGFVIALYLLASPFLAGFSSSDEGPFVPKGALPSSPAVKAFAFLALLVGIVAVGLPSPARAASSNPLNAIGAWADADVSAAVAASTQFPELQDQVGKACWGQISTLAKLVKAHPLPATLHLATDIEYARLDQGALNLICRNPNCAQVWNDMSNVVQSLSVSPLPLSFASLCSKVPVVGLSLTATTPVPGN